MANSVERYRNHIAFLVILWHFIDRRGELVTHLSPRKVRPRRDKRGVDLISDVLPFGRLWYGDTNAIGYAQFYSRAESAVIRFMMKLATRARC